MAPVPAAFEAAGPVPLHALVGILGGSGAARASRNMDVGVGVVGVGAQSLQKGSAEMLVLALLEERQRHGYEIAQLIEQRSNGAIRFQVPSLYPLLYRLERRGRVEGRWVERAGERRRRFYRLTPAGRKALTAQRKGWKSLFEALDRVASFRHA